MLWQNSEAVIRILAQLGKNAGETRFSRLMPGSMAAGFLMACTAHVAVYLDSPAGPGAAGGLFGAAVCTLGIFLIWLLRTPFFPFQAITGPVAALTRKLRPASLAYSWLVVLLGNVAGVLLAVFIIYNSGYALHYAYPGSSPELSASGISYVAGAAASLNLGFAAHFFRGLLFAAILGWALFFYVYPPKLISRAGLFLAAAFLACGGGFEQVVEAAFVVPMGIEIASGSADIVNTTIHNGSRLFPWSSYEINAYFSSIRFVYGIFIPVLLGNIGGGALFSLLLVRRPRDRQNEEAAS